MQSHNAQINALEVIDRTSLNYRINIEPEVALTWARQRKVRYTDMLEEILANIDAAFAGRYYKLFIGRAYSRVLYVQWYPGSDNVPVSRFENLANYADEYDVYQKGSLTEMRIWWD